MIPSMAGFGGWTGRHAVQVAPVKLSTINRGFRRFPDTYVFDYAEFMRDPNSGVALPPLANLSGGERANNVVAIVGTGISGLTAGLELARCGIKPMFFEAIGRVGGRAYTEKFKDPNYTGELGAMRVPSESKLFWHYFSTYITERTGEPETNIDITPFPNPGVVPSTINFGNMVESWWNQPQPGGGPEKELPEPFKSIRLEFLTAVIQIQVATPIGPVGPGEMNELMQLASLSAGQQTAIQTFWEKMIDQYGPVTFIEAVKTLLPSWQEDKIRAFAALGLGTGPFGPLFEVSFLEILPLIIWDYASEYQVPFGLSDFAMSFITRIADTLGGSPEDYYRLNSPVTSIERIDGATPKIGIRVANGPLQPFDYVIVGTTQRAMQEIGLDLNNLLSPWLPALQMNPSTPEHKLVGSVQSSMRVTNLLNSSKTFELLDQKPWNSQNAWPHVVAGSDGSLHPRAVHIERQVPAAVLLA